MSVRTLVRCARCGDDVLDHRVDDEERRECMLCECTQFECVPCRQCGAPVTVDRARWATPMCHGCLAPAARKK